MSRPRSASHRPPPPPPPLMHVPACTRAEAAAAAAALVAEHPVPSLHDPLWCCASAHDAFPPLGPGQCARLVHRDRTRLVYALGDGNAPFPYQHVTVWLPPDGGTPTVRWHETVVATTATAIATATAPAAPAAPTAPSTATVRYTRAASPRTVRYFTGTRVRRPVREHVLERTLAALHRRHEGDALRWFQRCRRSGTSVHETLLASHHPFLPSSTVASLAHHIWLDVLRECTDRVRRAVVDGNVVELLRISHRMERLYPCVRSRFSCVRRWAQWWWQYRLAARLRYRYPLLTRRAARLLADDVVYVTRSPPSPEVMLEMTWMGPDAAAAAAVV